MKPVDDNSLSQMVYSHWNSGRQRMQSFIEKCKEWDCQWDGIMNPKDFPWKNCSNLNVPITSAIGDTLLAYLVNSLLGQRPFLRVKPRGDTKTKNAKIMEAVIDDQCYSESNIFKSLVEAFHDGLRYGVWAVIVDWEDFLVQIPTRIAVPVKNEQTGQLEFKEQTIIREKKVSRPKITPQNITEIVVSPQATCINYDGTGNPADYVIFRRYLKMDNLKRNSIENGGVYYNLDKLEPDSQNICLDEVLREKEERLGVDNNNCQGYDFEGLEGWYWYDIDGDGKNELCIFTIAVCNGKPVIIRKQECPYSHYKIPLVWQKLFPDRGLYSRSVPSWLKDIQDEINTIHNQRRDAVSLSLLKMWKYRLGSRFDLNQEIYPGCMIGVLDMQDFEPVVTYEHGITPAISEEQLLNAYVERMTGISDYAIGRDGESAARATATGTIALIRNANLRIDLIIRYWRNSGLKELGELIGELNKQFYPIENKIEPFDKTGFEQTDLDQGMLQVLISDLEGEFKYEYIGNNNMIDRFTEREESVFLYDLLKNNPIIKNNPNSIYDLTKDLLRVHGKNDIYITSPEEIEGQTIELLKQVVKEAGIENRLSQVETARKNLDKLESRHEKVSEKNS